MEMQINVEDYLSREDIVETIREQLQYAIKKDAERILSNTAYSVVFDAVDKALDNKAKDIIKEKTIDIINKLSDFCLFRRADAWGGKASVGQEIVDKALIDNTDAIYKRVESVISGLDIEGRITQRVDDSLEDILLTVLKNGLNK